MKSSADEFRIISEVYILKVVDPKRRDRTLGTRRPRHTARELIGKSHFTRQDKSRQEMVTICRAIIQYQDNTGSTIRYKKLVPLMSMVYESITT